MATIQNTTVRVTHSSYYWNTFSVFTYWCCYNLLSISCVWCCLLAAAIRRLANFESLSPSLIWIYPFHFPTNLDKKYRRHCFLASRVRMYVKQLFHVKWRRGRTTRCSTFLYLKQLFVRFDTYFLPLFTRRTVYFSELSEK